MCGFIGVINNNREILIKKELIESLGKIFKYRGPDESGFFSDGPYGVYHQRLRVIDLTSAGKQPMQNREGTISIAYNGEVYNFKDLKMRYALDDKFEFRSGTDTEVLLCLYELLGIDFVHELNGMFAIAIWDSRKRRLYLIRDRFGIKPLFYTRLKDGTLWFSSEIKSLLATPGFEREVCFKALHHYFSFDYIPGTITAFEGIEEVKPGYFLEIHSERIVDIKEIRYWQPSYGNLRPNNLGETIADIRELLKKSVEYQLISDVPVGVMLSGGLDSSTIAVLMSQIRKGSDFHTFSIGFDDKTFDESIYAEIVAKYIKTIHHKIKITPKSVVDNIKKYILHIDEPYADGSAIPTYLLSQEAKNYVTVLLSGEGGDEVFAGYQTYLAYIVKQAYKSSPCILKDSMRRLAKVLPVSYKKLSFSFKLKKFIEGADNTIPVSHYKWREVFSEEEKRTLFDLDRDLESEYGPSCDLFSVLFKEINALDDLNKLLGIDSTIFLPDDLMIKNDRMTMAHSLEARVPFTDLELFQYLAKFAGGTKIHGLQLKYLLKKAMGPFLPRQILAKQKVGLELPYSKWFCSELKELLLDHLSESALKDIPFINSSFPQQLIREHLNKKADRGRELWGLLNFVIWYRLYFIEKIY